MIHVIMTSVFALGLGWMIYILHMMIYKLLKDFKSLLEYHSHTVDRIGAVEDKLKGIAARQKEANQERIRNQIDIKGLRLVIKDIQAFLDDIKNKELTSGEALNLQDQLGALEEKVVLLTSPVINVIFPNMCCWLFWLMNKI